jgi:hypothetical protein
MENIEKYKAFIGDFCVDLAVINSKVNGSGIEALTDDEIKILRDLYNLFILDENSKDE